MTVILQNVDRDATETDKQPDTAGLPKLQRTGEGIDRPGWSDDHLRVAAELASDVSEWCIRSDEGLCMADTICDAESATGRRCVRADMPCLAVLLLLLMERRRRKVIIAASWITERPESDATS